VLSRGEIEAIIANFSYYDIRTVQELPGHGDVRFMIHLYIYN